MIKKGFQLLIGISVFIIGLLSVSTTQAQIKMGTRSTILTKADSSALLSLEDTLKGFLLPRMTLAQRNAMINPGPATGLTVFVIDNRDTGLYVNYGTNLAPLWVKLSNVGKDTITLSRIDTLYNKIIQTDSIFSNSGKIDTLYNKIIQTDSIFSNSGKIDTLYNKIIQTDSIFSNSGKIDTLYNKISKVDTLFAKSAHFDTVTIGKLKIVVRGNYLTDSIVVVAPNDSLKKISYKQFISALGKDTIKLSRIDTILNKLIQTDSIFSNSGKIDTLYNKISKVDTLFAKSAHFDTVTIGKLKIVVRGNYLTDSIVVVAPNDSLKKISYKQFISALGKDTITISRIDTIVNKVIQTDSIFSNSGKIDTLYNKISKVDTLFAKSAHFDTVTIGKLKIVVRGNYLTDSIVVVAPNDSLKKISYKQFISALGKDTITISRIDTIVNKVIQTDSIFSITSKLDTIYNKLIQTDSIFSNTGKIDTLYNKISKVDTLFAKSAHFDTVTIGKLKIVARGNYLTDSIVVVAPNDSLKKISYKQFISALGKDTITISRIDTIVNKVIQTDSIFSITSKLDTIYNKLIQTDSIFSNTGKIDTLYNKISKVDTLFAKSAHFDTVTIGKLKIVARGNYLTDSIVVVAPNDSLKKISYKQFINALGKDTITISRIDTIVNKVIQTDSIFSITSKLDTIYNKLIQTDSIFSNTGKIDTLYNKISKVDTLFAKTAHLDTVTIGKLKIRVSGKITDSIVVVDPLTDSVKRISPSRLAVSSVSNDTSLYSYDGIIQTRNMATAGIRNINKATNQLRFVGNTGRDTIMFANTGNVGIGTSSPAYKLDVRGYAYSDTVVTKAIKLLNPSGGFSGYGISTNWGLTTVSDQRLKENIKPYTGADALKGINSIEIVEYDWKAAKQGDPSRHMPIGVIAQNVQKVFPDAVEFDSQSGNLTLRSSLFPYYLMKATQQLSKQVEAEKAKNEKLQKQIDEQGLRIQKLEEMINKLIPAKK